jgi:hypothetical protein
MAKKLRREAERVRKPPKAADGPAKKAPETPPKTSHPSPPVGPKAAAPRNAGRSRSVPDVDVEEFGDDGRAARKAKPNGTKKREVGVKEPPTLVLPVLAYVVFLIVCYVVGLYAWLPAAIVYPAFALGTYAIVAYAAITFRRDLLRSRLGVQLAAAWLVLTLLGFGLPLATAIFVGSPIAEGRVTPGGGEVTFPAQAGHRYMAFLVGGFTKLDRMIEGGETDGKDAKQKHYDFAGNWTLALRDPEGRETRKFDGKFTAVGEKRRLSKRGVGYHEFRTLNEDLVFRAERDGAHALYKAYMDPEFSGIQVRVYRWFGYGRGALHLLLAVLAMAVGALLDFLIKAKKVPGWFGLFTFSAGLLTGYGNYYLSESTPVTPVGTFIFALLIGGVIGLVFATPILYGVDYALKRLNRTYKLSL